MTATTVDVEDAMRNMTMTVRVTGWRRARLRLLVLRALFWLVARVWPGPVRVEMVDGEDR